MKRFLYVFVGLIVVGGLCSLLQKLVPPEPGTFWYYIQNPDAMEEDLIGLGEWETQLEQDARRAMLEMQVRTPEGIAELVDTVVLEADAWFDVWLEAEVLGALGDKAYPRMMEILADPEHREALLSVTVDEEGYGDGPLIRLCDIFDYEVAVRLEMVRLLEPFMEAESRDVRGSVVLIVASSGLPEAVACTTLGLLDADGSVRGSALSGIRRAGYGDRMAESIRPAVFDRVAAMWPKDMAEEVCDEPP